MIKPQKLKYYCHLRIWYQKKDFGNRFYYTHFFVSFLHTYLYFFISTPHFFFMFDSISISNFSEQTAGYIKDDLNKILNTYEITHTFLYVYYPLLSFKYDIESEE